MPEYEKAPTGAFCWVELSTTDPDAAKKFYVGLFGWEPQDVTMGDGNTYTLCTRGANHVGGLMRLTEDAKKMGAPPNWMSYVAVQNAAESTKKAASLGATVLFGPVDTPQGNFSVLQDPTGAVFSVWEAKQWTANFLYREHGSLGWNELTTTDVDRAGKFYTTLFGWRPEVRSMPPITYTTFHNGAEEAGGMMAQPPQMAGAPSMWTVYFAVNDADAVAAKATSLGGKQLLPLHDIPEIGRFTVLQDPQGATFAIIKFAPPA